MQHVFQWDHYVAQSQEQVEGERDGELVVISTYDGRYHVINGVGEWLWQALREPRRLDELRRSMADEYGIDEEQAGPDLLVFLEYLHDNRLIDVLH